MTTCDSLWRVVGTCLPACLQSVSTVTPGWSLKAGVNRTGLPLVWKMTFKRIWGKGIMVEWPFSTSSQNSPDLHVTETVDGILFNSFFHWTTFSSLSWDRKFLHTGSSFLSVCRSRLLEGDSREAHTALPSFVLQFCCLPQFAQQSKMYPRFLKLV